MRKRVYVECKADISLACCKNILAPSHAGVVDENSWMSDFEAHLFRYGSDLSWRGYVAFEVVDFWSFLSRYPSDLVVIINSLDSRASKLNG